MNKSDTIKELIRLKDELKSMPSMAGKAPAVRKFRKTISMLSVYKFEQYNIELLYKERLADYEYFNSLTQQEEIT